MSGRRERVTRVRILCLATGVICLAAVTHCRPPKLFPFKLEGGNRSHQGSMYLQRMTHAPMTPKQFEALWQCRGRRVRQLLGELEALGFRLEQDKYGARLCPVALARAVASARATNQPLASLRDLPELHTLLRREERDALTLLIEARAELAVLRETVGVLWQALQTRATPATYREPDWNSLGLPHPRDAL